MFCQQNFIGILKSSARFPDNANSKIGIRHLKDL